MDSNQTAIQTLQQQRGFPIRIFASMLLLTITIIALTWYSFLLGHKISSKFHPLVDAAMEIKLEATIAHLWLEEVISGDRNSTLDDIQKRFDSSIWYANAMLEGDKNTEGHYFALTDNKLRAEIIHVINLITEIKAMTQTRHEMIGAPSAGDAINAQYEATFDAFLKRADDIETSIQRAIADDLSSYDNLQILLIVLIIGNYSAK